MDLKMRTESSVQPLYGRRAGLFVTSQNFDHFERQLLRIASSARSVLEVAFVSTLLAHARVHSSQQREHTCALLFPRIQYKTNLVTIGTRKETLWEKELRELYGFRGAGGGIFRSFDCGLAL
jgi:hypothetical protein